MGVKRPYTPENGCVFHMFGKVNDLNPFFCTGLPQFSGWMQVLGWKNGGKDQNRVQTSAGVSATRYPPGLLSNLVQRTQQYGYEFKWRSRTLVNPTSIEEALPAALRWVGEKAKVLGFPQTPDPSILIEYVRDQGIDPHVDLCTGPRD